MPISATAAWMAGAVPFSLLLPGTRHRISPSGAVPGAGRVAYRPQLPAISWRRPRPACSSAASPVLVPSAMAWRCSARRVRPEQGEPKVDRLRMTRTGDPVQDMPLDALHRLIANGARRSISSPRQPRRLNGRNGQVILVGGSDALQKKTSPSPPVPFSSNYRKPRQPSIDKSRRRPPAGNPGGISCVVKLLGSRNHGIG